MQYLQQVIDLRFFWWSLVCNDFKNRYKRSFLGVAWSLARPVGMTCVLCIVFSQMFNANLREFAPYIFASVALWQFLTESVLQGCRCFVLGSMYLRQQQVPVLIFPIRTVLGSAIHLSVSLGMAFLLSIILNGFPSLAAVLSLIPGLLVLLCFAVGIATICGLINTHFPDTSHILEIGLQALYFLTPVIYPREFFADHPKMSLLIQYNPLASILELVRQPLLFGHPPTAWDWQLAGITLMLTTAISWWCLRKMERNLVYWI